MTNRWRKTGVAIFIGFCILAALLSFDLLSNNQPSSSSSPELYRKLKAKASTPSIHSWATRHLKPLTEAPEPSKETVLFWSIPKSGTTTVKEIYKCLGQTVANKFGALPRFGHDQDEELLAFHPWKSSGPTYVNVDTTNKAGILRAEELGLVPSGLADIIITSEPKFAIEHLYDDSHRGRVIGLFRHPVDRLVSKFYYLQIADWERTYSPEWKKLSVLEFATKINNDNNIMVKKLAGKTSNEEVTEVDLLIAMRTVNQRFIVGLTNQMEESIHRFNIVIGIDEPNEEHKKCIDHIEKKNSNPHPKVEEGSPAWEALAEKNTLDIRLYEYMVQLFDEQKDIIESYAIDMAAQEK
mmetsp:Transcript_43783/g.78579  ORF Transcript_43783/g.78579 Transcript_43783/m.78579 type:complete len:353 (+) Transcript_43783:170-1228(+)